MRAGRSLWILGIASALTVGAALWSHREPPPAPDVGGLALPALGPRINDTAEIISTHAGTTFRVKLADGGWVIPEKSEYPADPAMVRRFIVGLAELRKIEAKTTKAELHEQLGLDDPGVQGSTAVHLELKDGEGAKLADFKLGTRRPAKVDPAQSEMYFLGEGDTQAWLVEGKIGEIATPVDLLDTRVAEIAPGRIERVSIQHPDDVSVTILKQSRADSDFAVAEVPEGYEVPYQYGVNDIARGLEDLRLTDVMPESALGAWEPRQSVEFLTFEGLGVRVEIMPREGADPLIKLSASLAPAGEVGEGADPSKAKEEVASLSARWSGWVYAVPAYRISAITKKRSDLVQPIAPESADESG